MNTQQQQQQKPLPQIPGRKPNRSKSESKKLQKKVHARNAQMGVQTISIPASQGTIRRVKDPQFAPSGKGGDVIVSHMEYVADVSGSVAFAANQFTVNPGLAGSFPWLSAIAPNYESYRFESLEFEFQTTTNNQATGNIALFLDYDPADPAPTEKRQVLNSDSSVDGPVWSLSIKHHSKKENLNKRSSYLVRSGVVNAGASLTLYDVGNLFVCTQGQAGATVIGELFCRYRVRLMTPQMLSSSAGVGNSLYGKTVGTTQAAAVTTTGNSPLIVTGTPSALTFTAISPYQCLIAANVSGTTLSGITTGGTAVSVVKTNIISASTTANAAIWIANFNTGDTMTFNVTGASTTLVEFRYGQYLNSLG